MSDNPFNSTKSMGTSTYQVPQEMRDLADKSVNQAKQTFDTFLSAAQKATGSIEGASTKLHDNSHYLSSKAFGFMQSNVNAAFELAHKLINAKDLNEVLTLQGEYIKQQMTALQTQTTDLGSIVQKSMQPKTPEV